MDLNYKIVTPGIYHYQTEDMVVVEMNLDELIEESGRPIYTEGGWIKTTDINILNKARDIFIKLTNLVNIVANKNYFLYPKFLCGSENDLEEFYVKFNYNPLFFDLTKTYCKMNLRPIEANRNLYLCNDIDHINKINDNCYGNFQIKL